MKFSSPYRTQQGRPLLFFGLFEMPFLTSRLKVKFSSALLFSIFIIFQEANSLPITRCYDKTHFSLLYKSDLNTLPMAYSIDIPLIKLLYLCAKVEWLSNISTAPIDNTWQLAYCSKTTTGQGTKGCRRMEFKLSSHENSVVLISDFIFSGLNSSGLTLSDQWNHYRLIKPSHTSLSPWSLQPPQECVEHED